MRPWLGTATGLDRVAKVLTAAAAACVASGALVKGIVDGPLALALASAAGLFAALVLVATVVRRELLGDRELWEKLVLDDGPPRTVSDALKFQRIYKLGVETEAPEALRTLGLRVRHAPYLARPTADTELQERLRAATDFGGVSLVVIRGPAKAGKSRTLLEGLSQTLPEAWLIRPKDAAALVELGRGGPPSGLGAGPCVLWLNDLEDFAGDGDALNLDTLVLFNRWVRPVILLAAYKGAGAAAAERLIHAHAPVELAPTATPEELGLARAHPAYAAIADQIGRDGIAEYMIVAAAIRNKLMYDTTCNEGAAVAQAAIDWRRCGLRRPVSVHHLKRLYVPYLDGEPSDNRLHDGVKWAAHRFYSNVALLQKDEDGDYVPYDYAVRIEDERNPPRLIPRATWTTVLDFCANVEERAAVASEASRRGDGVLGRTLVASLRFRSETQARPVELSRATVQASGQPSSRSGPASEAR